MNLLLVRHGKAQKRGSVILDYDRKLLPKGIKRLKQDMPYLAEYLKGRANVVLWSSAVVRAMETAEMIKQFCEIDRIDGYDFIENGDFDELAYSLKQVDENSTIIIVGHEPYLSQWCKKICKEDVRFKKGTAVLIKILSKKKTTGKLLWVAEPGGYKKICKHV
ncbi:SixA phosphatase family protein [Acetobacterium tundrae]|uniref:Phosphohistidine phosphatase SixA n=1 Tax=Acetobacterium tundrae TaxID=132932 RepID=A0ABR6WKF9_9FIRM|nr:histidine phosphatase family protein [Acetobacterium tundrae]MBC3796970.1 hypothetical protein [Acetobacterium tundrae]